MLRFLKSESAIVTENVQILSDHRKLKISVVLKQNELKVPGDCFNKIA